MPAWLDRFDVPTALAMLGLTVVGVASSVAVTAWILVRLPPDFFLRPKGERFFRTLPSPWRQVALVAKNIAGLVTVALGVALSLPGVPGQGLLTILLGLMLLDFPGRDRLELAILRQPGVHRAVDRLRTRFGRPHLDLPP